jgi:alkylhydroperoxidase family enzyme
LAVLQRAVLDGPGRTTPERRHAAAEGAVDDSPLGRYLAKVRTGAYRTTDEEVEALRAAGHTDDELFELTIAASLGVSRAQLDRGLAAVAAAWEDS